MKSPENVRILVCDLEGVVTPAGGSGIPFDMETIPALRALTTQAYESCGLVTVMCSGRQIPYMQAVQQMLNWRFPVEAEVRQRIQAITGQDIEGALSIGENGACYFYGNHSFLHPSVTTAVHRQMTEIRWEIIHPLTERFGARCEPSKMVCVSVNPPRGMTTDEFAPIFLQELPPSILGELEVKWSRSAVDITPQGVSKAAAVSTLLDWMGLDPQFVGGVGDTTADADWLQKVGWVAVPSNGIDALPNHHFAASKPEAAGLIEIIHQIQTSHLLAKTP